MPAEANQINKGAVVNAKVREIDFVNRFQDSIKNLMKCLGITRKIPVQAGTVLSQYKVTGTLQSGVVAEGDLIPLSKYTFTKVPYKTVSLKKWRKATTAEAVVEKGYTQAVSDTNSEMLKDIQKGIRSDFFAALKAGKGTATGGNLQQTIARVWGKLQIAYEDTSIESVYFVNPEDVADYLGDAAISMQTAFGMKYIEDFLGMGTVITISDVPKGTVFGTAKDNIVLYYISVNGADLGKVWTFTSDSTGLIGIHEQPDYDTMTCEDIVVDGIEMFPERPGGIVKGTITPPGP